MIAITCNLPVALGIQYYEFSETAVSAWRTWVILTYENPEISVMHTLTCTHLTHNQPPCSSPPAGWDCRSYFFVTGPGQRRGRWFIFWLLGGGQEGGWGGLRTQDDLPDWQADGDCHWGPRCRDVQGAGVCGSKDKHQWEYERLDGNLSQEVRLYHCRRNHRREADLVRLCSAASLFGGGLASNPLQTGRYSVIVLLYLKTKASQL